MHEIRISYNVLANREKPIAHLVRYPDGVDRILSMRPDEWDRAALAERHNFPFYGVLGEAIGMAHEFPTEKGYDHDVLSQTHRMFRVIAEIIEREKCQVSNDIFKTSD